MDALRLHAEKTFDDVRWLVKHQCFKSAAKRVGELRIELEQRLDTEGRIVPIYISRTGDSASLALRLQQNHSEVRRLLDEVAGAIGHWEIAEALGAIDRIAELLSVHQALQDGFHPALDDLVPRDGDWEALRHRLLNS